HEDGPVSVSHLRRRRIGSPNGTMERPTVSWDDITPVKAPPTSAVKAPASRDQAYLIVLAGSAMGEMYKITHERTVIGRGQRADVRMMDEGVSREHCEIRLQGEKIILKDLGSTNG